MSVNRIDDQGRTWSKCDCCGRYLNWNRCRHCGKRYRTQRGLDAHEVKCYLNPERKCQECDGSGVVQDFGGEDFECYACFEAKKRQANKTYWEQEDGEPR